MRSSECPYLGLKGIEEGQAVAAGGGAGEALGALAGVGADEERPFEGHRLGVHADILATGPAGHSELWLKGPPPFLSSMQDSAYLKDFAALRSTSVGAR